jgi:hypothetical protein
MISNWQKFNESDDNLKEILLDNFSKIREVFYEFEDMKMISYSFTKYLGDSTASCGYVFTPGQDQNESEKINHFIEFVEPQIRLMENNLVRCNVDIKFPTIDNFCTIGPDGILLFEDLLTANSRLIDMGYNVELSLNGSHPDYKPMMFKIKFELK